MTKMENAGGRFKRWRELLGIQQQDVAASAEVQASTLCRWEQGRQGVTAEQLERLVRDGLKMTMTRFYGSVRK